MRSKEVIEYEEVRKRAIDLGIEFDQEVWHVRTLKYIAVHRFANRCNSFTTWAHFSTSTANACATTLLSVHNGSSTPWHA